MTETRLTMADGAELPLHAHLPGDGPPRAVILALHGFNDYGAFMDEPGAWLAARGIAVYAYDQRGFGATARRGLWAGTEAYVDDLRATARLLRARHPGAPLVLLGESMGGAVILVAATAADPPPADGLILAAPAVWARETMPAYQRAALWLGSRLLPWLRLSGRGLNIRPSDNIEMLRALGRDPLVIKETRIDALHGLTDLMDAAYAAAPRFDARALILYGAHDELVPETPTRAVLARRPPAARGRQRVALYDSGWHMLLRDLQAATVWADIAAWIADPGTALPSGADARATAAGLDGHR